MFTYSSLTGPDATPRHFNTVTYYTSLCVYFGIRNKKFFGKYNNSYPCNVAYNLYVRKRKLRMTSLFNSLTGSVGNIDTCNLANSIIRQLLGSRVARFKTIRTYSFSPVPWDKGYDVDKNISQSYLSLKMFIWRIKKQEFFKFLSRYITGNKLIFKAINLWQ